MKNINRKICIIPLKSNSIEVKNKNIKLLNGKPLFCHVTDQVLKSKIFDKIVFAIDTQKYEKLIKKFYNHKVDVFYRSKKSISHSSPSEVVLEEVLRKNTNFKTCCMIQATTPFLYFKDLINATKVYEDKKLDSLFSCYKKNIFLWSNQRKLSPINFKINKRPMRQKNYSNIVENGSFYFFDTKGFMKNKTRYFGKKSFYVISEFRSIDIDSLEDFNFCKKLSTFLK